MEQNSCDISCDISPQDIAEMPQYLAFLPQDFAGAISPKQAKSPEFLGFFGGGDKGTRTPSSMAKHLAFIRHRVIFV